MCDYQVYQTHKRKPSTQIQIKTKSQCMNPNPKMNTPTQLAFNHTFQYPSRTAGSSGWISDKQLFNSENSIFNNIIFQKKGPFFPSQFSFSPFLSKKYIF
jgi:hypothetical protein